MNIVDLVTNKNLHFEVIDSHVYVEKSKPGQHEAVLGNQHLKVFHSANYKCPLCGAGGVPKLEGVAIHFNVLLVPLESATDFNFNGFLDSVIDVAEYYGFSINPTARIIK